jgi:hypothetical protein
VKAWAGWTSEKGDVTAISLAAQEKADKSKHFFRAPLKRDTNGEIHPVLKMEYCPQGKTCRADSDEHWVDLDND